MPASRDTDRDAMPLVGVSSWIFGSTPLPSIAAACERLGFEGVELLVDIRHCDPVATRQLFAQHGLSVVSLTPENVDLAHIDTSRRQHAVDYYANLMRFAQQVGAPAVTCHEYVGRTQAPDSATSEWERLVESCLQLAQVADEVAVDVLFEPLNASLVSRAPSVATVERLVAAVDSRRFRILLDTYHLFLATEDPLAATRSCAHQVGAVQLADAGRRGLGLGGNDLAPCLRSLVEAGFDGPWIFECSPELTGPRLDGPPIDLPRLLHELVASRDYLHAAAYRANE